MSVGRSVAAAVAIAESGKPASETRDAAAAQGLSLFLFDAQGRLLTPAVSGNTMLQSVPGNRNALTAALHGRRYVSSSPTGDTTVVALPLDNPPGGALLAYNQRNDVSAEVGIVGRSVAEAGLWALLVGATCGLLVSVLITRRTRSIADAAARIEHGQFDRPLTAGFHDELGELAETVEAMRVQLDRSFSRLESERDRLQRLLERLHEGVLTVDPDGHVGVANPAAAVMLGASVLNPGSELPNPWAELDLRALARMLCADCAMPVETRVSQSNGAVYSIVGIPAGEPGAHCVLVFADITERERREAAEREFVANAAHELRTPITAITGAVEVLRSGAAEDPVALDRFLQHIERESTRLGRLTRSLLALARAQTGEEPLALCAVDLPMLLDEVTRGLGYDDSGTICRDGTDVHFLGHPDLAYQLMSNGNWQCRLSRRRSAGDSGGESTESGAGYH